jgi:hypothetical protein
MLQYLTAVNAPRVQVVDTAGCIIGWAVLLYTTLWLAGTVTPHAPPQRAMTAICAASSWLERLVASLDHHEVTPQALRAAYS